MADIYAKEQGGIASFYINKYLNIQSGGTNGGGLPIAKSATEETIFLRTTNNIITDSLNGAGGQQQAPLTEQELVANEAALQQSISTTSQALSNSLKLVKDTEMGIKLNQNAQVALAHQIQQVGVDEEAKIALHQQQIQLKQEASQLQQQYQLAKTQLDTTKQQTKQDITAKAQKAPLASTPENLARKADLEAQINENEANRLALVHQAQQAQDNPEALNTLNEQDIILGIKNVKLQGELLALNTQLESGKQVSAQQGQISMNDLTKEERTLSRQQKAEAMNATELELIQMNIEASQLQNQIMQTESEDEKATLQAQLQTMTQELKQKEETLKVQEEDYKKLTKESNPYENTNKGTSSTDTLNQLSNIRKDIEGLENQRLGLIEKISKAAGEGDMQKVADLHAQDSALEQDIIARQEDYLSLCAKTLGTQGFINLTSAGSSASPILDTITANKANPQAAVGAQDGAAGMMAAMMGGGNPMQGFMQMFQMMFMMQMMQSMFGGGSDNDNGSNNPFSGIMDMFSGMFGGMFGGNNEQA